MKNCTLLLTAVNIIIWFLWDVKNAQHCSKRIGDLDLSGVVKLHTTCHFIDNMGWVGTVSSKLTESGCQWCLCMLTSKLTIHMLMYLVKRVRLLSSPAWLLPSLLVILVTELSHYPSHPSHPSHLSYLISLVILVSLIALVTQVSLLNLTIPVIVIIIFSWQSSHSLLPFSLFIQITSVLLY